MGNIYHEWNGTVLTITSDSGTSSCDLKGDKGDTGVRGAQGVKGEIGIGAQGERGEKGETGAQGERGEKGERGEQGIQGERGEIGAQIVTTRLSGTDAQGGNIYIQTFADGTTATFTAPKGEDGANGADGYTPVKGTDYWTAADKREIFDLIYPVGAIYISTSSTSPQTLFTGTWQRIRDTFLLAAGNTYSAGSTGGSADAVVVSHTHKFVGDGGDIDGYELGYLMRHNSSVTYRNPAWSYGSYGTDSGQLSLQSTGEDGTGKNMPPYLAVYVWKRIA